MKTTAILECINLAQMQLEAMAEHGFQTTLTMDATLELANIDQKFIDLAAELGKLNQRIDRALNVLRIYDTGPGKYASDILKGEDVIDQKHLLEYLDDKDTAETRKSDYPI